MSQKMRNIAVAIATALLLAACTTKPIYNVTQAPVQANKPNPSMEDVSKAIMRAGAGLGWQMTPDRPGHMLGRLALRDHVAVVDIDYNDKTYSIRHKESTNLDHKGDTIHRNYNGWIQNLEKAIRAQLATL